LGPNLETRVCATRAVACTATDHVLAGGIALEKELSAKGSPAEAKFASGKRQRAKQTAPFGL